MVDFLIFRSLYLSNMQQIVLPLLSVVYRSSYTSAQRFQELNHPKELQCLCNCRFLFRWAFRLSEIFGFRFVVVFSLNDAMFLLDLGDIKGGNLQAGLL